MSSPGVFRHDSGRPKGAPTKTLALIVAVLVSVVEAVTVFVVLELVTPEGAATIDPSAGGEDGIHPPISNDCYKEQAE